MTRRIQPSNLTAIDIGTNSFHLVIARMQPEQSRFTILDRQKELVRLGSGSRDMKYISEGAMNRAIQTLRRFKSLADAFDAPIRAVATSAVREALNQDIFVRRVKTETGITVEVISGVEEARLIYLGVLQALAVFSSKVLMVDIGGGSTEFLVGRRAHALYANSLKLGAIRLTERFFRNDVITHGQISECRAFIKGILYPVVRAARKADYEMAVGSSGTIQTIANMVRARKEGVGDGRINNYTFTRKELGAVIEDIIEANVSAKRLKLPGIDPARCDIITAGALILEQIFEEFKLKDMTVSEFALREGIILDTQRERVQHAHLQHLNDLRYGSVLHLAETFHYEKEHANHVAKLAGLIFDATRSIHGLDDTESEFLEAAALLHEVGFFISHAQHHRHSYYLIRNSELLGFTENEKEIVANIARYHRKSHPKLKHEGFSKLSPQDQETVQKLSAILRIADGLDRTHHQRVKRIRAKISRKSITFLIDLPGRSDPIDLWGPEQKKQLFEETFGVKLRFKLSK
ncbi:MAG: HD domain-containing protein [Bacteroidota bacterium]